MKNNKYGANSQQSPVSLEAIARALGGQKAIYTDGGWVTLCPCHDDENPSLSLTIGADGELKVHCHAGCHWQDVKDELRHRGLIVDQQESYSSSRKKNSKSKSKEAERKRKAAYIWGQSKPDNDNIQCYLANRNIHLEEIPKALRWNEYKGEKKVVAAVTKPEEENVEAIHQTWITDDFHHEKKGMRGIC